MTKLLILSIYNENEYYDKMMKQTNVYLTTVEQHDTARNINYLFIMYKPIDTEYILNKKENVLIINGKDSMIPGILNKTIDAIDIITNKLKWEYDFVIRTTVATNVDTIKLYKMLDSLDKSKTFYIGNLQKLEWIDVGCGIIDKTYWGTIYAGGGFSLFSKSIGIEMINRKTDFIYDIVDDLSIGLFIQSIPNVIFINMTHMAEFYGNWNIEKIVFFNNTNKQNRIIDVENNLNINNQLKLAYKT
jgi:hypothetical protein